MKTKMFIVFMITVFSCIYANLNFKNETGSVFAILPNGSVAFSRNSHYENETPPSSLLQGQMCFSNGTTKCLWTRALDNNICCLKSTCNGNRTASSAGSLIFTRDGSYKAEVATNGDVNCYDGIFSLRVDEVHLNWNTSSHSNDALNIRMNASGEIASPEFTPYRNWPAAYIPNTPVQIKVKFRVEPPTINSLAIRGISSEPWEGCLGDAPEQIVQFNNGISPLVTYSLPSITPSKVWRTQDNFSWYTGTIHAYSTNHLIFIVLGVPQSPWTQDPSSSQTPWADVLNLACDWAKGEIVKSQTCTDMVVGAYNKFNKLYDGTRSHTGSNICVLSTILADNWVDCRDMSAVVQLFSQILGANDVMVRRISGGCWGIDTKPILSIGNTTWAPYSWRFHQVVWRVDRVYDACLKLSQASPRYAIAEEVNASYKNSLFQYGEWIPGAPFAITTIY